MSKEFSYDTMLATIGDALDDGNHTLEDIQMNTTNTDLWIIGTYKASQALEEFSEEDQLYTGTNLDGVFGAIEYVKNYEIHQYGEVLTNLLNPEKVASMVAFINGEQIINELSDKLNLNLFDELTEQQLKQLSSVKTMQKLLS